MIVTALSAADPGKSVMQNPAVKIAIDHFLDIRTIESISSFKPLFANVFEGLEMILHTLIIWRVLGVALPVNGNRHGYATSIPIDEMAYKQYPCRYYMLDYGPEIAPIYDCGIPKIG